MESIIFEPTLDEREKLCDRYYFMKADCSNCSNPTGIRVDFDVMVKKGVEAPKKKKFICPNCNCKTLTIY